MHSPVSLDPPGQESAAAHPQAVGLPEIGRAISPDFPRQWFVPGIAITPIPHERLDRPAEAFSFVLKEAFMFDEQPQPEIEALIKANPEFKQLYQRHKTLDKKVMDAELGVLPI